jgi:hypothetical protein
VDFLHLRAESVFVKADNGRLSGLVINGEDIEAAGAFGNMPFGEEVGGGSREELLFAGRDAQLWEGGKIIADGASANFNEGERFAIVADHVEFAFGRARSEVARDEDVAVAAEIPVGVSFAANASPTSGEFFGFERGSIIVAEALAGSPVDGLEDQSRNDRHCCIYYKIKCDDYSHIV